MSNSGAIQKSAAVKQQRHKPNPALGSHFNRLVRRYIHSLNNLDFMQSTSPFHLVAYFSIFQKIVWLLYEHEAIDENKVVKFISEIHIGFFGLMGDNTVPFGSPELGNHLTWRYYQLWNDNLTHLYALTSLIAIENMSTEFNELFIQSLAIICSIVKPSEILENRTGLIQVANSYNIPLEVLIKKLSKSMERFLPQGFDKLEKWNTTTTLLLKGLKKDELKIQQTALVSISIAAERIAEYLRNKEQHIYYCTELIFRTSQINNTKLNNYYQEKLVELLEEKGDLHSLARVLLDQSKTYSFEHNYDQAIKTLLQAKSIATALNDKPLLKIINIYLSGARFLL